MSGFWKVVSNAGKTKTGQKIISVFTGGSKTSPTITSVKTAPHLTTKRKIQDMTVEAADSAAKKANVPPSVKDSLEFKQSVSKSKVKEAKKLKGLSYKWDKIKGKKK